MSSWKKITDDDIDIDWDCEEVIVYLGHDDYGNNYQTLTFEQIKKLNEQIEFWGQK